MPPCTKAIPVDICVTLGDCERKSHIDDRPLDPDGIQASKSIGEALLILANTVFFAIKAACLAARTDVGAPRCFELDASVTVARIQEPYKTRLT